MAEFNCAVNVDQKGERTIWSKNLSVSPITAVPTDLTVASSAEWRALEESRLQGLRDWDLAVKDRTISRLYAQIAS